MNQKTIMRAVLTAVLSLVATTATAHDFEVGGIYYNYNGDGTVSVTFKGSSYNEYAYEYSGDVVIPSSVTYNERPYSVTSIDGFAFSDCSGLTSVTIPNSVTSIGRDAFDGCTGLTRVDISSIEAWLGISFFISASNPLYYAHHLYLNGEEVKDLIIPNSVTSIGCSAFDGCTGLTSVTIPNSVTEIGNEAFEGCSSLTSVTIPNSVTLIGASAFGGCSGLTRVDISSIEAWLGISFTTYYSNPLSYAHHLYLNGEEVKDLVIPNSVTSIDYNAFGGCSGLTGVTIPNSVTSIGDVAFDRCSGLTSVSIPNSVTSIGLGAFYNCRGLTSVTIPNSVSSIGDNAFDGCRGLTSVISKAITPPTCGSDVFYTATYSKPLIVPSVAKEAYQAASTWSNFSNYAEPDNKITAIVINNNEANLVINNTLQLSATVTPEDATFADVLQWTSSNPEVATVDDNGLVTAIAKGDAEIKVMTCDGSNLSASCTIKVALPTSHNFEVGGIYYKFNGKGTVEVTFKGSSYNEYADEYTGDVVIPSSVIYSETEYRVTSIGDFAFWGCSGLTSITIPNSVSSIGEYAFWDCSGLTSVTIPNSVSSIGDRAFYCCSGLTSIIVDSENQIYDSRDNCNAIIETASNKLLYGSNNTIIPNSVSSIGDNAFWDCSGLKSITIPNSVISIGRSAFVGCNGLTSVTIPNSVSSIGQEAFYCCNGLTSIIVDSENQKYDSRDNCNAIIETASNTLLYGCNNTIIPNSVTSIGSYAFSYFRGLTSITIPNSVSSIGQEAFYCCSGLTSIIVDSENQIYDSRENCNAIIETASNKLLYGCKNTIIPNSVTSIGDSAFSYCSGLTSVTIPNSVTSIGDHAFLDCSGLTSLTIPNSVTSIGGYAFMGCSGLTSVISKAVTPPTCFDGVFTAKTYSVPLIVPSVAKEAYQAASTWSNFSIYAEPDNKITAIAINNNEANLVINNTFQLSATVTPEDATFADVLQWTSSNPEVATVDDNGLVTAIAKGDAEITATTCDGSNLSASYTIKVVGPNDEAIAALNALVANAETLYKNSAEGDRIGDYTPGARAELFASIESVKSKISESMSLDEITACTNEINAAIQLFESKKVTTGEDTDVSLHENIIFIETAEAFVGKSVTLSLKMNNTIVPIGFQCDFYAPSKTSVPTDEDGFYAINLSTERTTASRHNIFQSRLQKDGGIRILAASTSNYPFAGNEGEVITITLNVDADLEEGEYPLILRNVIISDAQNNTYSVDYVKSTLTVSSYTPGDVNNDGSINIGDVTAVVSYIMGAEPNVFIKEAADVTGDGSVNIGDLTGIVGMIMSGNALAPATKSATKAIASPKTSDISGYDNVIYAKDVTFGEDGRATLSINMKNSIVTPAFQFDIVMPEGIEIEKDEIGYFIELSTERTTPRKTDIFQSKLQKDGSVRVIAASTNLSPFEGNDGEVCTVSLILGEGTAPGEYEVVLKNIIISDPTGVTCSVDKTTAIITVPGSINEAANVNELVEGDNIVGFGLQGVKIHNGVLYACTTAKSVNMSTPTLHGNNANNMAPYEDRNFADFDQRDWVAISGLEEGFEGKELSYPFEAKFANGVLTPSETITATAATKAYNLNTFRAENILHGGYSNYVEGDYTAYYVPARVNEVAKFMGLIETIGGVKYLYSNNAYGRKDGEGIKVENCTIEDNSKVYSLLEGILVADDSTEAGVKIIMLKDLGQATGVEGVDSAAARIYSANGNIIIAAAEDGEAAVYDFTGRLIKSVPVVAGDNTAVPVIPGCYIVRTGVKTQSVVVK